MKSKHKNIVILIMAVVIVIGGVFFASELSERTPSEFKSEAIDKYNELYNGEEPALVYIGKTGCGYCEAYTPIVDEVTKAENIDYYYIDLAKLTNKEANLLYASSEVFSSEEFGTPTLMIVGGGKTITYQIGYQEKDALIAFLTNAGII